MGELGHAHDRFAQGLGVGEGQAAVAEVESGAAIHSVAAGAAEGSVRGTICSSGQAENDCIGQAGSFTSNTDNSIGLNADSHAGALDRCGNARIKQHPLRRRG